MDLHDAAGWHSYITKTASRTDKLLAGKTTFINQAHGRLAREFHEPTHVPTAPFAPVALTP